MNSYYTPSTASTLPQFLIDKEEMLAIQDQVTVLSGDHRMPYYEDRDILLGRVPCDDFMSLILGNNEWMYDGDEVTERELSFTQYRADVDLSELVMEWVLYSADLKMINASKGEP